MLRLQIWTGLGPLQPLASSPCARARASLRGPLRAGVLAPLSILARSVTSVAIRGTSLRSAPPGGRGDTWPADPPPPQRRSACTQECV
ncbi:Single-minded 1 [Micractinium conductrix]|uniref:Single-minded 1 n=1 Tax=Micractinium conductrix TaxID=554055 RepID=A0A2P6VN01_9CHLO|nr:Single-minded 1 [Micractinium conductrix]|eukprot:PSC75425.1 Single-minded 1 [Micractinium conductrix]